MRKPSLGHSRLIVLFLNFVLASPGLTYDYPLASSAIRDAYFLGTRQGGVTADILKPYSRRIADLHQGTSTLLPCVVVSAWVFTEHSNIGSAFNGYLGLFLLAFLYIATVMVWDGSQG
jgi:hypothetical protein